MHLVKWVSFVHEKRVQYRGIDRIHPVGLIKGIRFIVLYPLKCSHDLLSLAGLYTRKPFQSPRDIPEQLAAYSALALTLSTALLMLGTHFAAG